MHAYLFVSNGYPAIDFNPEIHDSNGAYELSTTDSLRNAANYVMYVASKSNFPFPIPCELCSPATSIIEASSLGNTRGSDC